MSELVIQCNRRVRQLDVADRKLQRLVILLLFFRRSRHFRNALNDVAEVKGVQTRTDYGAVEAVNRDVLHQRRKLEKRIPQDFGLQRADGQQSRLSVFLDIQPLNRKLQRERIEFNFLRCDGAPDDRFCVFFKRPVHSVRDTEKAAGCVGGCQGSDDSGCYPKFFAHIVPSLSRLKRLSTQAKV